MLEEKFSPIKRDNQNCQLATDLVVAGGGLAGLCAAITAARAGSKVVLIQDRPVLGGNASSEIRLWALGATSHMGNNNRWSREGGLIDEIMIENMRINRQGNPLIFDALLLDKVMSEQNITLLLNTAVYQVTKADDVTIKSVEAFCSQNSTHYSILAPLFCDATGDGIVAFNAGAAFRIGGESKDEFNELLAPEKESSDLLGHSIFFYSKRAPGPVEYHAPSFAYTHEEIGAIPRSKNINAIDNGCKFWWIEYGGNLDTIHETEEIKWELWKIVYGVWDYIKNSGKFEDVDNLTLEWVGTVPGKRESRRFEGEYMIKQQDIIDQTHFEDAVSFGGWAIDIHPSDGVYSEKPPCSQYHSKGVYQIPYRAFISRDINNLFYAGRIISATHMAFGSTRVMITCAHGGQAVGEAAALCKLHSVLPKALLEKDKMTILQNRLNSNGQGIPGIPHNKRNTLISKAALTTTSTYQLSELPANGKWLSLIQSAAQLMPLNEGNAPRFKIEVKANRATKLTCQLRTSSKSENYTPDVICKSIDVELSKGVHTITLDYCDVNVGNQYAFVTFLANENVEIKTSTHLVTGLVSVFNKVHKAVSNNGAQLAPLNSGIEEFEFWTPERRPEGQNIALTVEPAIQAFDKNHLINGYLRPYLKSNAWAAALSDQTPQIKLNWPSKQTIKGIQLYFDTDSDHAIETVLMEHPESRMPFCVKEYKIMLKDGSVLFEQNNNHQTINKIMFDQAVSTDELIIELTHPHEHVPAALFDINVF